jgi:competence protein ComFC
MNIKDSFSLKNSEKIKDKNILLFDDILTTGATLSEAEKILRKAGAQKIIRMVIAH